MHKSEKDGSVVCPICESRNVATALVRHSFPYGVGPEAVTLTATVPVSTCAACEESFTGHEAEVLMHNAVCAHLGILNPEEVLAVRKQYGMSQQAFGKVTGIGSASLVRWETGALLQNPANDALLYLLRFPENMKRLEGRRGARGRQGEGERP